MFGYVRTDVPNIYVKDLTLYKAMYCGLCKGIGEVCGLKGRFALNYDLAFLSILVHNVLDVDVKINNERCVLHVIRKRPIASVDEITKRISALNVILAHYKLADDKLDENKGNTATRFFFSAYKKAKRKEPKLDKIVAKMYADLVELEKSNTNSIDRIADPFGIMMTKICKALVGDNFTEAISEVSYNLGKWIYLIDALDDFDKDKKKKNYNVFINLFGDKINKKELLDSRKKELEEIFAPILYSISENSKIIDYKFNHDLIDNVLERGLMAQTKKVMENKKCEKNIKF